MITINKLKTETFTMTGGNGGSGSNKYPTPVWGQGTWKVTSVDADPDEMIRYDILSYSSEDDCYITSDVFGGGINIGCDTTLTRTKFKVYDSTFDEDVSTDDYEELTNPLVIGDYRLVWSNAS